jgi:hypothetical protein
MGAALWPDRDAGRHLSTAWQRRRPGKPEAPPSGRAWHGAGPVHVTTHTVRTAEVLVNPLLLAGYGNGTLSK